MPNLEKQRMQHKVQKSVLLFFQTKGGSHTTGQLMDLVPCAYRTRLKTACLNLEKKGLLAHTVVKRKALWVLTPSGQGADNDRS